MEAFEERMCRPSVAVVFRKCLRAAWAQAGWQVKVWLLLWRNPVSAEEEIQSGMPVPKKATDCLPTLSRMRRHKRVSIA